MQIAIVNKSNVLRGHDKELMAIGQAIDYQLKHQFCAVWNRAPFGCAYVDNEAKAPASAMRLYMFDDADQAGALGYHDETSAGVPYGKVFANTIMRYGGALLAGPLSVSVTASHEALEMAGDVNCDYWAQRANGDLIALELCDPVEGDCYFVHSTNGMSVAVSNFVTPAYFDSDNKKGPFDWLSKLTAPFTMTNGGYLIVMASGKVSQEFADAMNYPDWKKAMKASRLSRTARR